MSSRRHGPRPAARLAQAAPLAYHRRVSALLADRGFRRLWLAQAISLFGDWFTYVAVGTLSLSESSGLTGIAVVLVAYTLPRAVLAPLAGVVADRLDRRAILVGASLLRALVVLGMLVAADAPLALAALLFVRTALSAFTDPAAGAALPQLVPVARLGAANALLAATWSAIFALGVAVGGIVTAAVGPRGALAIDAATFVLAAALFATLPRLRPGERSGETAPEADRERESAPRFSAAWRLAWRERALLHAALAKLPVAFANGGAWVLLHALAGHLRAGDLALALGTLHAARAAGTGVGPILWARIARLRGTALGIEVATALTLVAVVGFTGVTAPAPLLLASVLWGLGVGATWVTSTTRIQTLAPNPFLGRLAAVDLMGHTVGQCLGGLVAALLADAWLAPNHAGWLVVAAAAALWCALALLVRVARS